jgi:apolipoprotein N-acyltransferase
VVQGNVPGGGTDLVAVHRQVTDNHVRLTTELGDAVAAGERPAVDAVLWPENSTAVDPFLDADTSAGVRAASEAVEVPILLGAMVDARDPGHVLNQGIVWEPGVGGRDRYTKRHPVPFGEYIPWRDTVFPSTFGQLRLVPRDMLSGTDLQPLRVAGARVADVICFDVAYDDAVLGQVARGGQLLTVQTSNALFARTAQLDQQFEITRLRAIETGRWVAVASINGISAVVSPTGEVVATAPRRSEAVLLEQLRLREDLTPAVRMGLWPGRLLTGVALLGCLVAVVRSRARYRRRDSSEEGHA